MKMRVVDANELIARGKIFHPGSVIATSCGPVHTFSKEVQGSIHLLSGLGVRGDAHLGVTVQHRSRVAIDPTQPNLRQVHLIHAELFDELRAAGFDLSPGQVGENITTRGIDLLALPRGARLYIGPNAVVEVTGLRNPCGQLDRFRPGLTAATLGRTADGTLVRKAGVMGIVRVSGVVAANDVIRVERPTGPQMALDRV